MREKQLNNKDFASTQKFKFCIMPPKRKVKLITIELKKDIVTKYEGGMRVPDLMREFKMPKSTIWSILKKKDAIKSAQVAQGVKTLTKQRPPLIDELEKLLMVWITEKQLAGDSVSEAIISEKARQIYGDLTRDDPNAREFKASKGWFERFKKRTGIHNIVRHGEAASSNKEATEKFVEEFHSFITEKGFVPQQVFNCDETGLFWKKCLIARTSRKKRRPYQAISP